MIKTDPAFIKRKNKISLIVQTWLQIQTMSEKEVRQQLGDLSMDFYK